MNIDNISTGWKNVIKKFIKENPENWSTLNENIIKQSKLENFLKIFPKPENIFKCFHFFNPEDTKVVILGQDPYHTPDKAIGISFGVPKESKSPPSLRNIEKELYNDIGKYIKQKDLHYWAEQGVLMLNASLSVLEKTPASHMKLWKSFTTYIIDYLNTNFENIVFVAWGSFAYNKMLSINVDKHFVLVSSHPSPFSCRRNFKQFPPFLGSKPFSIINSVLKKKINW
jgi:uracil-DNA glycosylase